MIDAERPEGIIVQFGGQTPLKIAGALHKYLTDNPIPAASGEATERKDCGLVRISHWSVNFRLPIEKEGKLRALSSRDGVQATAMCTRGHRIPLCVLNPKPCKPSTHDSCDDLFPSRHRQRSYLGHQTLRPAPLTFVRPKL